MLTFILYELLKSPIAYTKLRQEVDSVLGTGENSHRIRAEDVSKLPYLIAVMREALRLHPPAPIIGVTPFEDPVIDGK
jgi:cytochrome P450/NADPH-cytochrome P450 reductase